MASIDAMIVGVMQSPLRRLDRSSLVQPKRNPMLRTPSYAAVLVAALIAAAFSSSAHMDAAQAVASSQPCDLTR
jgi:hypothetical protein